MTRDIERVVTFGPELAGERIGWVSTGNVRNTDDNPDNPISLNLVTATVGQNGAWFGYETIQYSDGTKTDPRSTQQGLLAVSAISTILTSKEKDDWRDEFNLSYRSGNKAQLLDRGISRGLHSDDDEIADWAKNRGELLDMLKGKLSDAGFEERYAQLYYWLNGSIARFEKYGDDPFVGMSLDELLVPDKNMKKKTAQQVENAEDIARKLGYVIDHDVEMRNRLTVFSDIPKEAVPDRFIDNRRCAAVTEDVVQAHLSDIAVRQLVYIPIGFRPNGRTWPYMDASEPDEKKAFGRELNGLKEGNIEPAYSELEREIAELRERQQYAREGAKRFGQLAQSEVA